MKKLSLLWGIALTLLLSFSTVHAEDFWQDTLWIRKIPLGGHVYSKVMFHPDGKSLFAASDHYLFRYDVQTGTIISTFEMKEKGYIRDYRISRDKQNLILISDIRNNGNIPCLEVWNIDTGYVRHYRYDNIKSDGQTMTVAMGKNDSLLYVGVELLNGSTHIIDYKSGTYIETKKGAGRYIDISPDGKFLISSYLISGSSSRAALIDIEKWQELATFSRFYEPKFSPDGRFFAGRNESENILLYDMENKKGYILKGHNGRIQDMCFTSDSKYLVSSADEDGRGEKGEKGGYWVWDIISRKRIFEAPYFTRTSGYMTVDDNKRYYGRLNGNYELTMWKFNNPIANTIIEEKAEAGIKIVPNPTQSFIEIIIPPDCHNGILIITDIQGKEILRQKIGTDILQEQKRIIDISSYNNGHYYLKIETPLNTYSSPFIINR